MKGSILDNWKSNIILCNRLVRVMSLKSHLFRNLLQFGEKLFERESSTIRIAHRLNRKTLIIVMSVEIRIV